MYLLKNTIAEMLLTKKSVQRENCKLSFIWGKVRTVARERAPQIALRNCSKQVCVCGGGVGVRIYMILVKGEFMQSSIYLYKRFAASHEELMSPQRDLVIAFLDMGRWKDWAHKMGS